MVHADPFDNKITSTRYWDVLTARHMQIPVYTKSAHLCRVCHAFYFLLGPSTEKTSLCCSIGKNKKSPKPRSVPKDKWPENEDKGSGNRQRSDRIRRNMTPPKPGPRSTGVLNCLVGFGSLLAEKTSEWTWRYEGVGFHFFGVWGLKSIAL